MTIKQQGGIFGRNPTFNDLTAGSGSSIEGSGSNVEFSVNRTDASTEGSLLLKAANGTVSVESTGSNKDLVIRTGGGTERARFYGNSGDFFIKGNLVVDSGQGIDFSATSGTGTSELFDDYEEGTWTPDVQDSSGNSASTSSASGTYTKVGDLVTAFMRIVDVDKSGLTAGDAIRVYGLPYTGAGSTRYGGSAIINTWTGTTGLITQVIGGNTYAQLKTPDNGNALVSEITSGSADIYAQVTYKV